MGGVGLRYRMWVVHGTQLSQEPVHVSLLIVPSDYYIGESMGDTNTTSRALRPYSTRASAVLLKMLQRRPANPNPRLCPNPDTTDALSC